VKVAFLVNDLQLSGGVGIVTQHAHRLSALPGWDVTLVLVREQEEHTWRGYEHLPHLHVRARADALQEHYDIAISTWWETTFTLFELQASRYAYFVQSLEDRFYGRDSSERLGAALTLDLPVAFITEARWIARTLDAVRPDAPCYLVRNGIDKDVFSPIQSAPVRIDEPLRVLVEGSPASWFKHVHGAIEAAGTMREPHHLTVVCGDRAALGEVAADEILGPLSHPEMAAVYDNTDVVLKLSSVEGMFGPPLEAFHRGATCVVTPVTGYEEYVEHGWNGLLVDWDDRLATGRQLDLLARDRVLLQFLRGNALETARTWPSLEQSSQFMAGALQAIARGPAPSAHAGSARMLADLRAGLESYERHVRERAGYERRALRFERPILRLRHSPPVRRLLALRRFRIVRVIAWPLRPLTRRARVLLKGRAA
jgi:glycosyltransferase involved in cell wall biosynthesis